MAVCAGRGGRDNGRKHSSCVFTKARATLSGRIETKSDPSRIAAADKNGARTSGVLFAEGVIGGYVAASATICDFIRSFASAFIFTTSLPPMVAAGALTSIRHLRTSAEERKRHQDRVARVRSGLDKAGVRNPSHIVPVMVCDPVLCKQISDVLIDRYGIYVQPINYPTVPRGTERLRITPAPYHTDADIERLVQALGEVWAEVGLTKAA
ncbi:aspartate/methionine/tyrosine aminotransferase [Nitrobacteraceae bacterium AZCC 2146]